MCIIMTTEMERPTITHVPPPPTPPTVYVEDGGGGGQLDDVVYHDEYVQMALFSLMKNLCTDDNDECQTSEPSIPSTPVDVTDAFHYKLEQAADSVKHHLLYAVREEVDALRGKVSDLERKIYRLEVENTLLLREYVPPEILEQMKDDIKRRRSSTCVQPNIQQLQQQQHAMDAGGENHATPTLSVITSIRQQASGTEKVHLVNAVENAHPSLRATTY